MEVEKQGTVDGENDQITKVQDQILRLRQVFATSLRQSEPNGVLPTDDGIIDAKSIAKIVQETLDCIESMPDDYDITSLEKEFQLLKDEDMKWTRELEKEKALTEKELERARQFRKDIVQAVLAQHQI